MNLSFKLISFREYKNWRQEEVAKELGLSLEFYIDLERGKVKINITLAQKLSDLYHAPIEFFIIDDASHYLQAEVMYNSCTFTSPGGSSGGYINHQYNDRGIDEILYSKKEEIKSLKQHIEYLQQENGKLTGLLDERLKEFL